MWSATRITADAAEKMQMNAGLLLNTFDVTSPEEPEDTAIVCDTTGDITISCKPDTQDFFEDVNNAPNNTMQGKRITGWTCTIAFTSLTITIDALKMALGATEVNTNGGVTPRVQYKLTDFKKYYWIGDMFDEDKLFVVVIDNAVSTEGITFTSTKNGKGGLAVTLTAHISTADLNKIPMEFYVLEKIGEYDSTKTYALNDLCTHNGTLYKCTTAITTPEAWNAEHWTEVTSN